MIYSWDTQLALCSQYVGILNIVMQTNWKFTNESETGLNIIPIVENACLIIKQIHIEILWFAKDIVKCWGEKKNQ